MSGSYVAFDPAVGGDSCFTPGDPEVETFCFRAELYTTDWEYRYANWLKFPADWSVSTAYLVGTPVCDSGSSWGTFSWLWENEPNEIQIYHPAYNAYTDHCVATYCVDVLAGPTGEDALELWYWDGDGYNAVPHHPCSVDGYTPASMAGQPCDEAVNPQAEIPVCAPASTVTINFQAVADDVSCPSVVSNTAVVSAEGNSGCVCLSRHECVLFSGTGYRCLSSVVAC